MPGSGGGLSGVPRVTAAGAMPLAGAPGMAPGAQMHPLVQRMLLMMMQRQRMGAGGAQQGAFAPRLPPGQDAALQAQIQAQAARRQAATMMQGGGEQGMQGMFGSLSGGQGL